MRIISGKLKGRQIQFYKSKITRPLKDVVKENIFNILKHSSKIEIQINNSKILDLYSGIGSFGIESISLGAQYVTFIEKDQKIIKILRENLVNLSIANKAQVFNQDIKNTINDNLKNIKIKWRKQKSMTIVLCSKGYPGKYKKNIRINNLNDLKLRKNSFIFHAGTRFFQNKIYSVGGRVLNITSIGNNLAKVRNEIIKIIKKIKWKSGFFRKDIGWKIIN